MVKLKDINIEASWKEKLNEEFAKPYFLQIKKHLIEEKKNGYTIYPPGPLIFNAFNVTPFDKIKVVILGQDPYHGPGQAMGLSFSVPKQIAIPASLKNIYNEISAELNLPIPIHGDLSSWAKQGVFLLNAMLTVRHKSPSSHMKIGWQIFTDAVIKKLSDERKNLVFMLWGNFAKSKAVSIDKHKHLILTSAHPSPFSYTGFKGNGHFLSANEYLTNVGLSPINWKID